MSYIAIVWLWIGIGDWYMTEPVEKGVTITETEDEGFFETLSSRRRRAQEN